MERLREIHYQARRIREVRNLDPFNHHSGIETVF